MAYSDVKTALNEISEMINAVTTRFESAKSNIQGGATALGNIPTKYVAVLTEIDAYTGTDAAEQLAQAEKAKLYDDYVALKARIDALIATTEFSA